MICVLVDKVAFIDSLAVHIYIYEQTTREVKRAKKKHPPTTQPKQRDDIKSNESWGRFTSTGFRMFSV